MAESKGNGGVLMMILGLLYLLLTWLLHAWCCPSHLPFSLPIISSFPPDSSFWINLWSYQSLDQNLLWRLVVSTELRGWLALQSFSLLPLGLGPVYSCPCSLNGSRFFLPLSFPFWLPFCGNILLYLNILECHFCFLFYPLPVFPPAAKLLAISIKHFLVLPAYSSEPKELHLSIALHVKIIRYLVTWNALG